LHGCHGEKEQRQRNSQKSAKRISAATGQPRGRKRKQRGNGQRDEHDRSVDRAKGKRRADEEQGKEDRGYQGRNGPAAPASATSPIPPSRFRFRGFVHGLRAS
jgi:hypothetical protein